MAYCSYPFSAVIGQETVKQALILNLINPQIGGVLLSGEKGTAKSTLVRGLGELSRTQVVDLPLNATEDRVVGSISIEKTVSGGKRVFEPGILKKADGEILYIDEVNLLNEHIVNSILEASSSGINRVEREGISMTHPAHFTLVGSMNPEEGFLRSQLLDRFGIYVEVSGSSHLMERKEIVRRRLLFEQNPRDFIEKSQEDTKNLALEIEAAKGRLAKVKATEPILKMIIEIVNAVNCAGHRGELVMFETARALAAWDGRENININDVKTAAELALPHRKREKPEPPPSPQNETEPEDQEEQDQPQDQEDESSDENQPDDENEPPPENSQDQPDESQEDQEEDNEDKNDEEPKENNPEQMPDLSDILDQVDEIGRVFAVKNLNIKVNDRKKRKGEGKRIKTHTDLKKGQYIKSRTKQNELTDLAFDATLREAAPFQNKREKNGLALCIKSEDIREKVREKRSGSTIVFVVDASGSMGAKKRMSTVKGAIVSLLTDAYQKRDRVGLVAFRKQEAEVLLNVTRSVDLAQKSLQNLPTGGKTPLADGLVKGYELIKNETRKNEDVLPIMVVVSDGRTNVGTPGQDPFKEAVNIGTKIAFEGIQTIVVDTESDFIKLGLAKDLAANMGAQYYRIEELESDLLADAVREMSRSSMLASGGANAR
ncbi:magnesium chelatase subunit D family protein [Eubacteriaceae bacterium ES3]|nr:magnesium chelatase subunit D family protein [Eubacteriaceae bacterium ES3]